MSSVRPRGREPGKRSLPSALPILGIVVLVLLPTAALLGVAAVGRSASAVSASSPVVCPFNTTEDASARNVALAAPSYPLAAGDTLTTTYELRVTSTTLRTVDLNVSAPSFFAKF